MYQGLFVNFKQNQTAIYYSVIGAALYSAADINCHCDTNMVI